MHSAIELKLQIQELVGGLDTNTSFAAFDKMEEKVLSLEAEAESTAVLIGSDSMEGKFKELEGNSVNDELAAYDPFHLLTGMVCLPVIINELSVIMAHALYICFPSGMMQTTAFDSTILDTTAHVTAALLAPGGS